MNQSQLDQVLSGAAKEAVRRYLESYNTQQLSAVMAFVHPDHRYNPPGGGQAMNRDEREADERFFFSAFSDIESVVEEQIAEGDRVASRITMRCTQTGSYQGLPATGRRITIAFIDFARVRDGKILEEWAEFDMMGILRQLKPEG